MLMLFKSLTTLTLGNADALSRLPQPQTTNSDRVPRDLINLLHHLTGTTINASNIRRWTDTNPILSRVRQFILQGWPNTQLDDEYQPFCKRKAELSVLDGCVSWGSRVVVPPPGRQSVLEDLHDTHLGASKMKSLARAYIWWPKMDNDWLNHAPHVSRPVHILVKHHYIHGNGHHSHGVVSI